MQQFTLTVYLIPLWMTLNFDNQGIVFALSFKSSSMRRFHLVGGTCSGTFHVDYQAVGSVVDDTCRIHTVAAIARYLYQLSTYMQ